MKKIFLFAALVLSLFAEEPAASTNDFKKVIMSVDGEPVTKIEIIREVNTLIPTSFYHSTVSPEKMAELEKKAKNSVFERKLLYLYGKKIGIIPTKKELDEMEAKIVEAFKSKEKFEKALITSQYTYPEFRKGLEEEYIVNKVIAQKITIDFSESELKRYYEENKYKFKEPEKIKVRLIYVKNDPADPKGKVKAREKAEEALVKIRSGDDFADIAALYSEDMYRIKGGDMGYIHKGRLEEDIDKVAFTLPKGQMSGILENTLGCFIVKVEDKKLPNQLPFEKVKFSLKQELIAKREKERRETLLGRLKKDAVIKEF